MAVVVGVQVGEGSGEVKGRYFLLQCQVEHCGCVAWVLNSSMTQL